ncbi:MAG: Rieske (2Fe-2S) protein [Pseudomonadota bacterium]
MDKPATDAGPGDAPDRPSGEGAPAPLEAGWQIALPSGAVRPGGQARCILGGQPVLVGRTLERGLFAFRDVCPHRLVPLSAGRQVDTHGEATVECPYHGWRFGTDGVCRLIPSLTERDSYRLSAFRAQSFPVFETAGAIFLWPSQAPAAAPLQISGASGPPLVWAEVTLGADSGDARGAGSAISALGWSLSPDGMSARPESLAARRLCRAPGHLEIQRLGDHLTIESLHTDRGVLSILIGSDAGKAHLLIWWLGRSVFALGAWDMRTGARRFLNALAEGAEVEFH